MVLGTGHHLVASGLCHRLFVQCQIAAAAFVPHRIQYRCCTNCTDKVFQNLRILRIIHLHGLSRTEQKTSVICGDLLALQRIYHFLFQFIEADLVPQYFQIMQNFGFALIRLCQLQIIVCFQNNVVIGLHIMVDLLDDIMTGRTKGNQRLSQFLCFCQCTNR